MVAPCIEALKQWTIAPARIDGQPISAQVGLTINVTAQGVVVTRTAAQDPELMIRRITGNPVKYRTSPGPRLDRLPTPVNTTAPKYATAAAQQGVRGKIQVHFYIDEKGMVRMPAVDPDAQPYLSDIAVAALLEWRFEPPTSRGKPVLVAANQEFNFSGK